MTDPIARLTAALEGRYSIERELGQGGMATVYLARDVKHNRNVALKVLKPELAAVVGAERFLAEIETTAQLQHPHILPLFDSGEADSFLFYVMPHVEGESLREKLDREHQLPVDEALSLTKKVADALDYAHENGVVHRDIKPGNILLSARGEPLVGDFGIALAVAQAGGGRITETGLSLGTPHYMSPEQATGDRDIDPRSDVYALGCVLYEMLAGEPPFSASTAQAILAKILTMDAPSIATVRRTVPAHVDNALAMALEKLPADRFASAAKFATALDNTGFAYEARQRTAVGKPAPHAPATKTRTAGVDRRAFALVTTVAVAALGLAAWGWLSRPPDALPVYATRLPIDLGAIQLGLYEEIAVSPDGSRFAVTGEVAGERALYWRSADGESFRAIPGTAGAQGSSFSPDGDWIVFATDAGGVYKVSLSGGAPVTLVRPGVETLGFYGPHWGDDGTIVFKNPSGSFRVPDTGGDLARIPGFENIIHTHLLPGGSGALGSRIPGPGGIMFADFATGTARELTPVGHRPKYVETGHILYVDVSGGLWALPFDASNGEVLGDAVPILDGVSVMGIAGYSFPRYAVSRNGTLVYGAGGGVSDDEQRLVIMDLEGNEEVTGLPPRSIRTVRWSPDGRSVVYESVDPASLDSHIYTYDVELGTSPRQLTFEGSQFDPVYSPDGTSVAFSSSIDVQTGDRGIYIKSLTDDTRARLVATLPGMAGVRDWVSDAVIAFEQGPNPSDLWVLDMSDLENPSAELYLSEEADLDDMVVSPDGDRAAYVSDEGGRDNVYVRGFPAPGERTRVSESRGLDPRWSPDGETVYYWDRELQSPSAELWAARLSRRPTVVLSRVHLFTVDNMPRTSWDVHPDGNRLVTVRAVGSGADSAEPERFVVVTNWFEELRERIRGS